MQQFSPNCFEKSIHEQHRQPRRGPCTLMSCSTASRTPGHRHKSASQTQVSVPPARSPMRLDAETLPTLDRSSR